MRYCIRCVLMCIALVFGGALSSAYAVDAEYPFTVTTSEIAADGTFKFKISAKGEFIVDCGDGGKLSGTGVSGNTITRTNTTEATYTCTYSTAGAHTIKFGGLATGYSTGTSTAAISFYTSDANSALIQSIDGSLGAIFPTLETSTTSEKQPRFYQTFYSASNITSIPAGLFSGISGAPVQDMFYYTFYNCSSLQSIPAGLFDGIQGAPAQSMFYGTFAGCSSLQSIPAGLFDGISGVPVRYIFNSTFYGCSKITSIPAGLFDGIQGAPAEWMFDGTFKGCSSLQSIPDGLFSGIKGRPASAMFSGTFYGSSKITSIPDGLFSGIKGRPASYMFSQTFYGCSKITSIPDGLFSGISGAPANNMFSGTFYNCSSLESIPAGLFNGISGAPASNMFSGTFYGCSKITSIPDGLFGGIQGAPASAMFSSTFTNCNSLQSIPAGLFSEISGAPANMMFWQTFYGCSNLTGYVSRSLFGDITDLGTSSSVTGFENMFLSALKMDRSCPAGMTTLTKPNKWGTPAFCDFTGCPEGYAGENATKPSDCSIMCPAGTYVAESGASCTNVGFGYWAPESTVVFGNVGERNACPVGLTTTGAGVGAGAESDCGAVLHFGDYTLRLRSAKRTSPALAVQYGEHVLYGDMSQEKRGHLRTEYNHDVYSIFNLDLD